MSRSRKNFTKVPMTPRLLFRKVVMSDMVMDSDFMVQDSMVVMDTHMVMDMGLLTDSAMVVMVVLVTCQDTVIPLMLQAS